VTKGFISVILAMCGDRERPQGEGKIIRRHLSRGPAK
jgi:hypothetical protein